MREVPFFGELYRRTTEPLLSGAVTRAEAAYLAGALELRAPVRALDVGCGSGRHLAALAGRGAALFGVDLDSGALAAARRAGAVARADLRALPFAAASFGAAWCWYSTLASLDEAGIREALAEVARVLSPGGRFVLQALNPARLAEQPTAHFERRLPDGSLVRERSTFDEKRGVDEGERWLELPGGEVLCGRYRLRHHRPEEWAALFAGAGLRIVQEHGSVRGDAFRPEALDLILLAARG